MQCNVTQCSVYIYIYTGWWFQTCFIFYNISDVILPIDELIFFKMVKTNKQYVCIYIY